MQYHFDTYTNIYQSGLLLMPNIIDCTGETNCVCIVSDWIYRRQTRQVVAFLDMNEYRWKHVSYFPKNTFNHNKCTVFKDSENDQTHLISITSDSIVILHDIFPSKPSLSKANEMNANSDAPNPKITKFKRNMQTEDFEFVVANHGFNKLFQSSSNDSNINIDKSSSSTQTTIELLIFGGRGKAFFNSFESYCVDFNQNSNDTSTNQFETKVYSTQSANILTKNIMQQFEECGIMTTLRHLTFQECEFSEFTCHIINNRYLLIVGGWAGVKIKFFDQIMDDCGNASDAFIYYDFHQKKWNFCKQRIIMKNFSSMSSMYRHKSVIVKKNDQHHMYLYGSSTQVPSYKNVNVHWCLCLEKLLPELF